MKTDQQIKKDIVDRLKYDSRVDASNIKVKVDAGKVTLSGNTLTYSEKIAASDIAWYVSGVTSVEDQLTVEFPSTYTVPSDSDIKSNVNQMLDWNTDIDSDSIDISVTSGLVTLEGSVPTYWQKLQAENDAGRVNGVIGVTNKIAVVPTEEISDEIIGERLMDRIEQNAPAYVDEVNAKVEDGGVTLSGSVPTFAIWDDIFTTAVNTIGVTEVEDNINISYV